MRPGHWSQDLDELQRWWDDDHLPRRGCHGSGRPGPRCHRPRLQRLGGWGKGFVLAISSRWPEPEAAYRRWARTGQEFGLGMVQLVKVADHLSVANLVAQHGYVSRANPVAIRYDALAQCLSKLAGRIEEGT